MTNDFKTKILEWIIGNYNVESGVNEPQFLTPTNNTNNLQTKLNAFFGNNYAIYGTIQGANRDNNGISLNVVYGGYGNILNGEYQYGFIYILDSSFNEIQMLRQYMGGTNFGSMLKLNVSVDGTFYGIENTTNGKRLIILNNFLLKLPTQEDYQVVYRQGYLLQGSLLNSATINAVIKNENAGRYFVSGTIFGSYNVLQPYATQVEIVVGGENVWTQYTLPTPLDNPYDLFSSIATWDSSNNISIKLTGWVSAGPLGNTYTEFTNDSSNNLVAYQILPGISNIVDTDTLVIDSGTTYIAYIVAEPPTYEGESLYVGYVNYETNSIEDIFTIYNSSYLEDTKFEFFKINNQAFYSYVYNNLASTNTIKIGKLIGTNYYEETLGTTNETVDLSLFSMINQFNLYNYFVQINNVVYECKQIFNTINYNGVEYQGIDSMNPNSGIIYDTNNIVIFARNLYNLVINNNSTIATMQVPNQYINDIVIQLKELIGKTNNTLISDSTQITTNIYEELLINYINTLIMSNQNDINNIILNNIGATRLNNSISQTNDYTNTKITYYRVNFSDNTYRDLPIALDSVDLANLKATFKIVVFNPSENPITNVQIISGDKATTYLTIDGSNLETDKYYMSTQDIVIE